MDVALGQIEGIELPLASYVLILVVMDVALGQEDALSALEEVKCLNPCCNGCRTWAGVFTNT